MMLKLTDFNSIQIVIMLAMYKLSVPNKAMLSSSIQNYLKESFFILVDNNGFNNSISKKRKGIEYYGLSDSRIVAGGQKHHSIKKSKIEFLFFPNHKQRHDRMEKLIRTLEQMTKEKGYPLDGKVFDEAKSQKNLQRMILVLNSILATGSYEEALRYYEFV